jgi:outer membrane protein assembly factor BamB
LEALARATGKALWRTPTGSSDVFLPLALGDGALYVSKIGAPASTPAVGRSDTLQALNAATGAAIWSAPLGAGIVTSAALDAGSLYVLTGIANAATQTTQIGLIAVDATTGKIRWQKVLPDAAAGTPVVANWTIYAAEQTPTTADVGAAPSPIVEAFNASAGDSLWRRTLAGQPGGYPLMASSAGVVTVVQTPPPPSCEPPPPVSKTATPSPNPAINPCDTVTTLLHLSAATGAQTWSAPLPGSLLEGAPQASASAVYTATLIQGASGAPGGAIKAYRLADGKLIWNHAVAEGIPNPMRLSGASLYLVATPILQGPASQSAPSMLEALSAADGSLLWKKSLGSEAVTLLLAVPAA